MHYYKEVHEIAGREVYAYRVENNNMGSPRWVVHFLDLLTQSEIDKAEAETKTLKEENPNQWVSVTDALYEKALAKVREVGGRKYRAKWFGGGFVIQSHNLRLDLEQIFA
tara:strand:+ start:1301 stop:1630 length:330 start_codon:yes stop_codon:yes gene_type:complete